MQGLKSRPGVSLQTKVHASSGIRDDFDAEFIEEWVFLTCAVQQVQLDGTGMISAVFVICYRWQNIQYSIEGVLDLS